ncbi:MAG: restriction endonuclease subunit S [Magnetococcales bacterium]|nr:restriction endonuclease subunit S [Magnetococcales bacterium]
MNRLEEAFAESDLPIRVDLLDWWGVSDSFRAVIEKGFEILQKGGWDVGSEWVVTTLGKVVSQGGGFVQTGPFGSQLHASDYVDDGIPCIMPINIVNNAIDLTCVVRITQDDADRLSRHIVKADDIIYSRRGDVTRKALIRKDEAGMFCGTGCLLVRPGNGIDAQFLFYHLSTPQNQEWIVRHAIGATMPNLNTGILSKAPLRIPEHTLQKAIAHILGSLDDKIELNRQMNETLESMAQALFKSWFVDFDPVIDNALAAGNEIPDALKAKAATRQALGAARKTLPDQIRTQFPSAFEFREEMGWVPEGWEVRPLNTLIDLIGGGTPKTSNSDCWGGDIPWFSVVDAPEPSDVFVVETEKHVTKLGVENSSTKILRTGTTIISARGTVGKCAIVGYPMAMNQSCYGINGIDNISDIFTYYTILLRVSDLQLRSHGSVFSTITRNTFGTIQTPFGGEKLTVEFEDLVRPFFDSILEKNIEKISLKKLRDTLLPKLLSGQLRIPDAEKLIENAL